MKIFVVILCLLSLVVLAVLPVLAKERVPVPPFTIENCDLIKNDLNGDVLRKTFAKFKSDGYK